ncbi:MAG: DUF2244 domain-containing protein [Candidatus Thiodiazotropha sp.]|nr:DUF2244 domain-containing protein [Candidatus Thiodiazotropha sp.]MCU7803889.1 DUF2244 domain-containing protein [Candidatus Thiodiazotropha sp. (ex Lucinoma borealis)]MCU7839108.1 DUF2244 domain-containing protein [Candidatus Thiodiazotropha sp. (ex Troendleina suluensis)]MCU7883277.1 DUF2244 domain-containing protein [Candidatus Thiodiazotropha sp. (ex Lucinoma annulata)]MCM8884738.1 DUF2244 domain-containing protein [Candidatus Thiodiazotropha sp.]
MVLRANQNSDADEAVLIIQPNRNLTWNQSKWLFLFFAFSIGLVGSYFYSLGAWLVLPFAGLEIVIVGIAIYCQSCCAHSQQVISIDGTHVRIRDNQNAQAEKCFHKAWLKIIQNQDPKGWYPSRLLIGSHGEYIEIGKNLVEEEREMLANNLRSAIEGA